MEINTINQTFPALSTVLPNQNQNTGFFVSTPPAIVSTGNFDLSQQDSALVQAQNLILNTLHGINPSPQAETILNRTFNDLSVRQQIDLLAQSNILLNEALQNLGISQQDALLIAAEALLRETLENLNASRETQQAAQTDELINQTFRDLGNAPLPVTSEKAISQDFGALNTRQPLIDNPARNISDNTTSPEIGAATTAQSLTTRLQDQTTNSTPIVSNVEVTTPSAFPASQPESVEIIPKAPFLLPVVDPTPFGVSVYEVNKLKLTTLEPEPINREVKATQPIAKSGVIDQLLLGPQWQSFKQNTPAPISTNGQLPTETTIRNMISHFNEEQVVHNLPLHLVLKKNESDLALDIYDCSDNFTCHTVYETHITQNDLPTLMDNLRHEAGFFVNTAQ